MLTSRVSTHVSSGVPDIWQHNVSAIKAALVIYQLCEAAGALRSCCCLAVSGYPLTSVHDFIARCAFDTLKASFKGSNYAI
jgi:hypothetical protein